MTTTASPSASVRTTATAPTLTFLGAAGTVTGSKTLLEVDGRRVLVDCGLFQGRKELRLANWEPFAVPPESIDAVVVTHAHIDHCGYLPRLVKLGFRGRVLCTDGTRDLARIVLPDSAHLQEEDAAYANRKGYSKHRPALPLYTGEDAQAALRLLDTVPWDEPVEVVDGVTATWRRAGHILGAASIGLHLDGVGRDVTFSGDLGRPTHPLLAAPAPIGRADVVVCESTYAGRHHDQRDPTDVIADVVERAARHGGVVVIPAFAVDRTEVVLWHLDRLVAEGRVPDLPVFVDSPMACRALDAYRDAARRRSPELRPEVRGRDLFASLSLREARSTEESIALNDRRGPMIVISASGMATGGRVLHHLANRLGDSRNEILLVGFQAPGTRGDALRQGARRLKLLGSYQRVAARVSSMELSSHADGGELVDWLATDQPPPGIVYVNHGEPERSAALVDALDERLGIDAVVPRPGERVRLDH
ncbi:MAG: MBL fold metallo-hydrolase [Actinomycetota bacterium]|nr:MBL fold metallo-hydrolase [Actinomycetota bacterium]